MNKQQTVTSSDGVRLRVYETGNPKGLPMLFIHGWSQCYLTWVRQLAGELSENYRLIAFDLRGHGNSDVPTDVESYNKGTLWADDVHAIVTSLGLERPVLVGSSYAGFIICDYLKKYNQQSISAVNFCGAAVHLSPDEPKFGKGFVGSLNDILSDCLSTRIDAVRGFVRNLTAEPLSPDDTERVLAYNMMVPVHVKQSLLMREENFDDVLKSLTLPVLVSQGDRDTIVLPAMSEHIAKVVPGARLSVYGGAGHVLFREAPEQFDTELRELAERSRL